MVKKYAWRAGFLGVTALAVAMEIFAIYDGDTNTEPYTRMILDYIPANIFFLLFGAAGLWVVWHFVKYYLMKGSK